MSYHVCNHVLSQPAQPFLYAILSVLVLELFVQERVFFLEGTSTFWGGHP